MATIQDTLARRQNESAGKINDLYNKQYDANAANLKATYDRNVSDAAAAQQKIAPQYQTQANQMAAQYERNRRNMNLQNMNNGMGTGTAVQQQEALNNAEKLCGAERTGTAGPDGCRAEDDEPGCGLSKRPCLGKSGRREQESRCPHL